MIRTLLVSVVALLASLLPAAAQVRISPQTGGELTWDKYSLMVNGRRVVPAMGEVHYSRIPAQEWEQEVRKMKDGGIGVLAVYVFWNHIEEIEGQYDWSGQRNLRRFLEICKQEDMPVVLRIGPFCHGEARCGGIPDWLFTKGCKPRSEDPVFLSYVARLYRQIFTQVQGLQWKDHGPVIAAQFDNEFRGRGSYLMTLKKMAQEIGFDLPFYTRTGWPELSTPVPFGEMIPLYGDYADGFWDRSIEETAGNYYKAFNFKAFRSSTAIATEQFDYSAPNAQHPSPNTHHPQEYPYFTCELGGGMATAYHRRPYVYPEDAYSMAIVKLGSGSNLLGYYMYHGGTNPDGHLTTLNEMQRTVATNYNDLPVKTYDFQAPLGEFGQKNPHYYMLRKLHLFMQDWGEVLAPMEAVFPCPQDVEKGDDSFLRWSYRTAPDTQHLTPNTQSPGFIFINNYERLQNLTAKRNVRLEACGVKLPKLTIPAGTMCIFPVNIDGIRYATAQLIAKRNGNIYMEQIKGIPTEIAIDGRVLRNLKAKGKDVPVYKNIYLLDSEEAGRLFLDIDHSQLTIDHSPLTIHHSQLTTDHSTTRSNNGQSSMVNVQWTKVKEAGAPHTITIGVQKVAEEPTEEDFANAAVYAIDLSAISDLPTAGLLTIDYRGDVARLYAITEDGSAAPIVNSKSSNCKLLDDNFYDGHPFRFALWRLPANCRQLELRILPLQKDMPVYFPREADTTPGENVNKITIQYTD